MVSAVLFPLMALFIWLDSVRYKAYIPLFIAGKCVGIFSIFSLLIIARRITFIKAYNDIIIILGIMFFYIVSLVVAILLFLRENKSGGEKPGEENKLEVV